MDEDEDEMLRPCAPHMVSIRALRARQTLALASKQG